MDSLSFFSTLAFPSWPIRMSYNSRAVFFISSQAKTPSSLPLSMPSRRNSQDTSYIRTIAGMCREVLPLKLLLFLEADGDNECILRHNNLTGIG
jgi:hypothetical protein